MADTKITALTALTAADPSTDVLPIVDTSDTTMAASGTTKKISINNILGASGTATLASATISGDLTVDTNTLKVTASTDTVTVGATTTDAKFRVVDANYNGLRIGFLPGTANYNLYDATVHEFRTANVTPQQLYTLQASSSVWYDGAGGTRMTLNSTGLGVGQSPSDKFNVRVTPASGSFGGMTVNDATNAVGLFITGSAYSSFGVGANSGWVYAATNNLAIGPYGAGYVSIVSNGSERMRIDSSGNVLVGTTTNAGVRLDVQTTTGNCIGRVKSNDAASTASFIIDYVETLGCTYIKKAGSDVWIYGVQNDTSATPAFKINTASNVGVQLVSGATAWTTLSDETVKDIIEPISNAVAKVGSIRSVIGKFKTDDSSKRRSFLIAQDVQSVLPEAVDVVGENNELGLRYTEVIPLLVAAIKELTAEVNALKNA